MIEEERAYKGPAPSPSSDGSGTKPCPFCGRQINARALALTSHQRAHVRVGEAVEVEYPGCAVRRGKRTKRQPDSRVFMTPEQYEEHKERIVASRGYLVKSAVDDDTGG